MNAHRWRRTIYAQRSAQQTRAPPLAVQRNEMAHCRSQRAGQPTVLLWEALAASAGSLADTKRRRRVLEPTW
jgi:hypothetical protein